MSLEGNLNALLYYNYIPIPSTTNTTTNTTDTTNLKTNYYISKQ